MSGVSVATVSRVLNGTATVREETRQRVLERVRELDYVPNAAARTLVRRRSQVIGVVVNTGDTHPDLKHPFFGDVLVGLRQALGASHYDLLLFTERKGFLRRAVQHQLDGLVLMGVDRRDPDLRGLLERRLPAMNVDLDVSGPRAGYVMSDNVGGARTATRHLVELGHVRIATITGLSNTKPAIDRLRGYREELLAHGLLYRTTYVRARRLLFPQRPRADAPPTRTSTPADGDLRGKRRDGDRCGQRDSRGWALCPPRCQRRRLRRHRVGVAAAAAADDDPAEQDGARTCSRRVTDPAHRGRRREAPSDCGRSRARRTEFGRSAESVRTSRTAPSKHLLSAQTRRGKKSRQFAGRQYEGRTRGRRQRD